MRAVRANERVGKQRVKVPNIMRQARRHDNCRHTVDGGSHCFDISFLESGRYCFHSLLDEYNKFLGCCKDLSKFFKHK